MEKLSSVKKNYLYNVIYQLLILILPLITAPYLSRVVGAQGVGIYSYTYSIVYYFMLICLLGVNNYGNRCIAKTKSNKDEMSRTFWGIYAFQLLMGFLMIFIYLVYVFCFESEYKTIALIQSLYIVSSVFDINWFYFGLEEFKLTITRNSFVKIGSVILIFIFVKSSSDLWKYTLIMSGMTVLSQLLLWRFIKKRIKFVKIKKEDILKHIKPNFILFIPVIATSIYRVMDKIMVGSMSTVTEVGYYENAEKIINVPLALISALGTVMLPRISNILVQTDNDDAENKIDNYIDKSTSLIMFMSFAMSFGIIAVGYNFAPLYYGIDFQKSGVLMMILAITIPMTAFANILRTQYLIPKEMDKIYLKAVFLGAMINLIFNFIFIPYFASIGACLGTIAAEFSVMLYQIIALKKNLSIKKYLKNIIPFFIKAIIMFVVVYALNYVDMKAIIRLAIQIILGCAVYGVLNIKYIFNSLNIKSLFKKNNEQKVL